jgi:hypothetical protein
LTSLFSCERGLHVGPGGFPAGADVFLGSMSPSNAPVWLKISDVSTSLRLLRLGTVKFTDPEAITGTQRVIS